MASSVVVPAYNEIERIRPCLVWCLNLFDEVIVVCDGTDGTEKIVREYERRDRRVKLVLSHKRLGKGGAFFAGFDYCTKSRVFLVDVDIPVPSRYVTWFDYELDMNDVVVGVRDCVDNVPLSRKVLSLGYRQACKLLFRSSIKDFQCGFKAFHSYVLDSAKRKMKVNGFGFDTELLLRCLRDGFRICQVNVPYSYSVNGKVSYKQVFSMTKDLVVAAQSLWQ